MPGRVLAGSESKRHQKEVWELVCAGRKVWSLDAQSPGIVAANRALDLCPAGMMRFSYVAHCLPQNVN